MPKEQSAGKPTTRRYSPEEKAAAVRMVRALRAELGTEQGTVLGSLTSSATGSSRCAPGCARPTSTTVRTRSNDGRVAQSQRTAEIRELKRANEILKRAASFFGASSTANTRSSRLHRRPPWRVRGRAHHHRPAQRRVTVAPSTYYDAKTRPQSARAQRDAVLGPALRQLWTEQLLRLRRPQAVENRPSGRPRRRPRPGRAADAGRRHRGARRGKRVRTTKPDPAAARHPDLVQRQFTATAPNQLWVTDRRSCPPGPGWPTCASSSMRTRG